MGRRGPARTPTAILELRGSRLAPHRRKLEPRGSPGVRCPRWLTGPARREFGAIAERLEAMSVVCLSDSLALAQLAELRLLWRRALRELRGEKNEAVARTRLMALLSIERTLDKLHREFGLTPSSRSRLERVQE